MYIDLVKRMVTFTFVILMHVTALFNVHMYKNGKYPVSVSKRVSTGHQCSFVDQGMFPVPAHEHLRDTYWFSLPN